MAPHGDGRTDGGQRGSGQTAGAGCSTKQVPPPKGHLGGTSQATGDNGPAGSQGWTNGGGLSEAGCHGHVDEWALGEGATVHAKPSLLPNPGPKDRFSLASENFLRALESRDLKGRKKNSLKPRGACPP